MPDMERDRISIEGDFLLAIGRIQAITDLLFHASSDLEFNLDMLEDGSRSLNSLVDCVGQEARAAKAAYEELENLCLAQEGRITELEAQS